MQVQPVVPQLQQPQVLTYIQIPSQGERGAPTVDIKKPWQLIRFFKDLELLFTWGGVTSKTEKKEMVLWYVELELEEVWGWYPDFKDQTKTYNDFKNTILAHYPESSGKFLYSLSDIDILVGNWFHNGIRTLEDLTDYHNQFEAISLWLLEKCHIEKIWQTQAYVQAFQPQFWDLIKNWLIVKHPNIHPNVPYPMSDVYEITRAILQGSYKGAKRQFAQAMSQTSTRLPEPQATTQVTPNLNIKVENFGAIIAEFTKNMAEILSQSQGCGNTNYSNWQVDCNFCGGKHYICDCKVVDEYVQAGKCRCNINGKVVLLTSAYVPREIPGTLLMEQVDEWHRWNPGQLATATLVHTIDKVLLYPLQPTYQLSSSDRIAHLEAELFTLKARRSNFVPLAWTRAQTARRAQVELSDEEEDIPAPKKIAPLKVITQPTEKEPVVDSGPVPIAMPHITMVEDEVITIEHPFRNAKDTAYTPPTGRNIGAPAPQANKNSEPAYKQQPTIYKVSIATDVYSRIMDRLIMVTQWELLSLSPEVRAQIQEAITTRRITAQGNQEQPSEAVNFLQVEDSDNEDEPEIPTTDICYS